MVKGIFTLNIEEYEMKSKVKKYKERINMRRHIRKE
jgi:hypothetical protein